MTPTLSGIWGLHGGAEGSHPRVLAPSNREFLSVRLGTRGGGDTVRIGLRRSADGREEEKRVGSTLHVMTPDVDGGTLVAQSSFTVTDEMTLYDCYERSYSESGPLTVESFLKIRDLGLSDLENAEFGVGNDLERSYFGF